MRIKAKIKDIEDWFIIDAEFSGEVLVSYEIFERIQSPKIDVGSICMSNENLIGERALIKLGLVINYKDFTISDP